MPNILIRLVTPNQGFENREYGTYLIISVEQDIEVLSITEPPINL